MKIGELFGDMAKAPMHSLPIGRGWVK